MITLARGDLANRTEALIVVSSVSVILFLQGYIDHPSFSLCVIVCADFILNQKLNRIKEVLWGLIEIFHYIKKEPKQTTSKTQQDHKSIKEVLNERGKAIMQTAVM